MSQVARSRSRGFRRAAFAPIEPLEGRRLLSAAGDLDPTFGRGGVASLGYAGSTEDMSKGMAVMPDGRIVVGGSSFMGTSAGTLSRYLSDGTPDPSFGPDGNGQVRLDVPWQNGVDDLVVNPDGSVIAIGTPRTEAVFGDVPRVQRFTPAGAPDPAWVAPRAAANITGLTRDLVGASGGRSIDVTSTMAVRLNADGTLDATFGFGGKATYNLDSARQRFQAYAGALQPDGALVLVGEWYSLDTAMKTAAVRRYTAAGQLDATFGAGGTFVLPGVSSTKSSLRAVGLDPAGNIVAVGYDVNDSLVARFTPAGAPDPDFAAGLGAAANPAPGVRIVKLSETAPDKLYSVAVEPDGRVLAAGFNEDSVANGGGTLLLRLTAGGDDDWSFGTGGVQNPAPDPWLLVSTPRLALQDVDGSNTDPYILMSSGGYATPNSAPDQTVARFYPDGSPDTSFGENETGMVVTDFRGPLSIYDGRPALQEDGKLVFPGAIRTIAGGLVLGRLNADGTPDLAFGPADGVDDAVSTNDFGARTEFGRDVIPMPGGKLVVVGGHQTYDWTTSWHDQFFVARFNSDGTLDDTFGDGGKTISDFGGSVYQTFLYGAAQPDGKVLGAGLYQSGSFDTRVPIVVRYTEDGQPDETFGDGGKVLLDLPGRTEEFISAITATADGGIVVTGLLSSPVTGSTAVNYDRFVVRLNGDGTFDTTFGAAGGGGIVILDNGSRTESSIGLAVGTNGALYVAGTTPGTSTDKTNVTLTRLSAGGIVDGTFGTAGTATIPLPNLKDAVTGFRITPQGQFLLSGTRSRPLTGNNVDRDFLVMRLDASGAADLTFGPGGTRSYDLGSTADGATDAFPTADGKIVIAGHSTSPEINGAPYKWSAIRVEGVTTTPPPASVAGRFVFYNGSSFDANRPVADPFDDGAVAPDKHALLPGQAADFSNVTGYSRGINGIMVDVRGLPGDLTAADFDLAVGTPGGTWAAAPAPASVTRRAEVGTAGSDRVTLTWADGDIKNTWLRVTVKANAQTGLSAPDVFYFGNLIGETGDTTGTLLRVNAGDLGGVKRVLNTTPNISSRYDFNRDGRVNALDLGATKANLNRSLALPAAGIAGVGMPVRDSTPLTVNRVWDDPAETLLA
jgi:uncharacterized delta-60 repeat protein